MEKFCTKWNEKVTLENIDGRPTCITSDSLGCDFKCKYSLAATMLAAAVGDKEFKILYPGFFDYTIELKDAPMSEAAKSRGAVKICDVCTKPTYAKESYLLHDDTILSSDAYLDFVIQGWVNKGLLPAFTIAGGITDQLRSSARNDVKKQAGGTPWLVCKSCLSMFNLNAQDKAEAATRAAQFCAGKNVEGVKRTKKFWKF